MRPVENERPKYYQPGELWVGHKITNLSPCNHAHICKRDYINFMEACGGFERNIEGERAPKCLFWVVEGFYLSDARGGRRL